MLQFYVAREVVLKKEFVRHAYAHENIGCYMNHNYYVKEELVLIIGSEITGYRYLKSGKECKVINAELLQGEPQDCSVILCVDCDKFITLFGGDCTLVAEPKEEIIGITGLQKLEESTNVDDMRTAIALVKEYNQEVTGKYLSLDEYCKAESKIKKKIM